MPTVPDFEVHPLADAFPLIQGTAFDELVTSIETIGQQQPCLLWNSPAGRTLLIDGRNRLRAARVLGIEPLTQQWTGTEDELPALLIALNLARRHLKASQRAAVGERLATLSHGGARQEVRAPHEVTLKDAAALVDVGVTTLQYIREVRRAGRHDLLEQVEAGTLSARGAAIQTRQERTASFHAARRESASDAWLTPAWIVERAVRILGHIDLDPCSGAERNIPAARIWTAEDNALAQTSWANEDGSAATSYVNPPYGFGGRGPGQWTRRVVAEYRAGHLSQALMLLPGRLGAHWLEALSPFPRLEFRRGTVSFIPGLENPLRNEVSGDAPFPVILVGVGVSAESLHREFSDVGVVMQAYAPGADR